MKMFSKPALEFQCGFGTRFMCLAIPVKVIKVEKDLAEVDMAGVKREVNVRFLEDVRVGDYILVHAGFAIEKINEQEAQETLRLLKDVYFE